MEDTQILQVTQEIAPNLAPSETIPPFTAKKYQFQLPKTRKTVANNPKIIRKVIHEVAVNNESRNSASKKLHISYPTVCKILENNRDLYSEIMSRAKDRLAARAVLTADKAVKKIKNSKLEASTALSLSQIAKNLSDLTKQDTGTSINFNFDIPKDKESLIRGILDMQPSANYDQTHENNISTGNEKQEKDSIMSDNNEKI